MPPKEVKKIADKLTDSEKKKIKQENKAKANPEQAAAKKEKSDAKRERRKVRTSTTTTPNPRRLFVRFLSILHPAGEVLCRALPTSRLVAAPHAGERQLQVLLVDLCVQRLSGSELCSDLVDVTGNAFCAREPKPPCW
jgi:hypothetical protein